MSGAMLTTIAVAAIAALTVIGGIAVDRYGDQLIAAEITKAVAAGADPLSARCAISSTFWRADVCLIRAALGKREGN